MYAVVLLLLFGNMVFGDLDFYPTEFGPKDVYYLAIFDKNFKKPQEYIDDNPDLPYCQIMGKFVFELEEQYSTITPMII